MKEGHDYRTAQLSGAYLLSSSISPVSAGGACHLVEFPGLAEDVQCRLEVFLAQVYLPDHLQNLAVRRMRFTQDLLVHLE